MITFQPGDRIHQVLPFMGRTLERTGKVLEVRSDGVARVEFGPDSYSRETYHSIVFPTDRRVQIIEQAQQPLLFGGGA